MDVVSGVEICCAIAVDTRDKRKKWLKSKILKNFFSRIWSYEIIT